MPRRPRNLLTDLPQLISMRGHNGAPTFSANEDYATYLSYLQDAAMRHHCALHAYCLLPSRVVLLCTPERTGAVSAFIRDASRRYVPYFNACQGRSGALWDGRYRAAIVEPSGYVLTAYRFIDTLAVAAGLCAAAEDYPWSSYRAHAGTDRVRALSEQQMFTLMASGETTPGNTYRQLTRRGISQGARREIEEALHHSLVLGCELFKERLAERHGIKVRLGRPGRPRKDAAPAPALTPRCRGLSATGGGDESHATGA